MAEPLLDRIHSELRARVRELQSAVGEYEQLQVAEAALAGLTPGQAGEGDGSTAIATPSRAPAPRRSPARRRSSGPRAPRGANRAAVLRVLEERPGVSVPELAAASSVQRTVLYPLLKTLEQRGEV